MEAKRPKSKIRPRHVLAVLLVYLLASACGFVLFGGLSALPLGEPKKAAPGYRAKGEVQALRVQLPEDSAAAVIRAHFDAAVAYAKENAYNTLIFEMGSGAPPADDGGADPLAQLFAAADGQALQIWLEVDPFAGTETDGGYSLTDGESRAALVEGLSALPAKYPVGGFVFTGFEADAAQTNASQAASADYSLAVEALLAELHTALADMGRLVPLSLAFDEGGLPDAGFAARLVDDGLAAYLLPRMKNEMGDLSERLAKFGTKGVLASPVEADSTGLFLFMAARSPGCAGAVLGTWPDKAGADKALSLHKSAVAVVDAPLPEGFDLPQLLGISYPAQNAKITTGQVFIMGTSDPAQPLLLDGAEVTVRADSGVFGVAVDLEMGENSFTFTQGERSVTLNVIREAAQAAEPSYPADGTYEAENGQAVVVTALIASALKDPYDPASINETFPQGAVLVVETSEQIQYDGRTTWVYRLKSGDYVHGDHCRLVTGDGAAQFTGLSAMPDSGGEWLDFEGTGTPGAYVAYGDEDGSLRLTFYDTALAIPDGFASQHVSGASVEENADGSVTLVLQTQDIWGYSLEYQDGATRLYLKTPPRRGSDPLRPLEGVTILLDPGHGDTDGGSPGVLWDTGPHEKDINLALAQAVSYRLQQLGATVVMTRSDDSFPTLQDRLSAQTQQKPDFFLSIHHNARNPDSDLNDTHGSEGYYYHPYSVPASHTLAQNLVEDVTALTGRELRMDASWGYYYVTRTTVCPSVLFEYGFAMNPAEYTDITSADGLYAAAFATAQAIVDTLPPG